MRRIIIDIDILIKKIKTYIRNFRSHILFLEVELENLNKIRNAITSGKTINIPIRANLTEYCDNIIPDDYMLYSIYQLANLIYEYLLESKNTYYKPYIFYFEFLSKELKNLL